MKNYSFIIPHHNTPVLLHNLLYTIPQRDDIEVIVVDDNSDADKKPQMARGDVRIINIPAQDSKGAGHARNLGLEAATGKWLLFADSDDFYEQHFLEELDKYAEGDNDIVFFSAHIQYDLKKKDVSIKRNYIERAFDRYNSSSNTLKDVRRLALTVNAPWNKMFRHDFIEQIQARFEEIPMANDAWFVKYSGSKAEKIEVIDKRLYYYVQYESGTTNIKRPLEHYYLTINSSIRRNKILYNEGFLDLIKYPGFNHRNVLRDFGRITYLKLLFYKIRKDPTFVRSIFFKVFGR